jgi:hypothetical protein
MAENGDEFDKCVSCNCRTFSRVTKCSTIFYLGDFETMFKAQSNRHFSCLNNPCCAFGIVFNIIYLYSRDTGSSSPSSHSQSINNSSMLKISALIAVAYMCDMSTSRVMGRKSEHDGFLWSEDERFACLLSFKRYANYHFKTFKCSGHVRSAAWTNEMRKRGTCWTFCKRIMEKIECVATLLENYAEFQLAYFSTWPRAKCAKSLSLSLQHRLVGSGPASTFKYNGLDRYTNLLGCSSVWHSPDVEAGSRGGGLLATTAAGLKDIVHDCETESVSKKVAKTIYIFFSIF